MQSAAVGPPFPGSLPDVGDEQSDQPLEISIEPRERAGVWANYAKVTSSPYEFTLDFVRLDFSEQPPTGIVVSRVSLSPLLVTQLIDALQLNWQRYAERSLPKEVYDDGSDSTAVAD